MKNLPRFRFGFLYVFLYTVVSVADICSSAPEGRPEKLLEIETLEKVATGFRFTEGPVWNPVEGFLLFSDIPADQIVQWKPAQATRVFREPSHRSNGMTYDSDGRLIVCEHGSRSLTRTERDGKIEILASSYQDKRLNSPNDVVVSSRGVIYFTDPPYGVTEEERELDFCGVYSLDPDGTLRLEYRRLARPNGLALAPDERILYVADTEGVGLQAFPVGPDGRLGRPSPFGTPGLIGGDGLKVDQEGNVYATGKGGVWMWDRNGDWIGLFETPEGPANCAFGDADGKTLYITAHSSVYKVRCRVEGIRPLFEN